MLYLDTRSTSMQEAGAPSAPRYPPRARSVEDSEADFDLIMAMPDRSGATADADRIDERDTTRREMGGRKIYLST